MFWTLWIGLGSVFAALGVAMGAFGSHALKHRFPPEDLAIFETAVRYQMYHAFALLAVGFLALRIDNGATKFAGSAFCLGIILFSGSLYALVFSGERWLGMIAPVGGAAFIAGWLALALAVK